MRLRMQIVPPKQKPRISVGLLAAAYGGRDRALQDDKGVDGGDAAHCRVAHAAPYKECVRERIDGVEHQPRKRGERETQHLLPDAA